MDLSKVELKYTARKANEDESRALLVRMTVVPGRYSEVSERYLKELVRGSTELVPLQI